MSLNWYLVEIRDKDESVLSSEAKTIGKAVEMTTRSDSQEERHPYSLVRGDRAGLHQVKLLSSFSKSTWGLVWQEKSNTLGRSSGRLKCRVQFADYDMQMQVCVQLHVHSESKLLHHQHLKRRFSLSADLLSRLHRLQRPLQNVKPSLIEELNPNHIFSFMLPNIRNVG